MFGLYMYLEGFGVQRKMGKSNYFYPNIEHRVTGIGKMRKINEDESDII